MQQNRPPSDEAHMHQHQPPSDDAAQPRSDAPVPQRMVEAIEAAEQLDPRAELLGRIARPVARGASGRVLAGQQIGHALHPVLTALPMGCWTSATMLDVVGGRSGRPAARRLTALGILATVPAALSGLVEYTGVDGAPGRRVATAHALGNAATTTAQFLSWRSRRRGHHVRGVLWGLAGMSTLAASGHLGGHLAYARGVGVGTRVPAGDTEATRTADLADTPPDGEASSDPRGSAGDGDLFGVPPLEPVGSSAAPHTGP